MKTLNFKDAAMNFGSSDFFGLPRDRINRTNFGSLSLLTEVLNGSSVSVQSASVSGSSMIGFGFSVFMHTPTRQNHYILNHFGHCSCFTHFWRRKMKQNFKPKLANAIAMYSFFFPHKCSKLKIKFD